MKINLDKKIGFNIGWDYYSHGFILPNGLTKEEFDLALIGYQAAKNKNIKRLEDTIFIRKWLNLRINAWTRNRTFDNQVTPEFIQKINVIYCPITNIKLTHGTGNETDWSIDRVNNNAAYSPGNLIIVSVLANVAKGNYSYHDLMSIANDVRPLPGGTNGMRPLTKIEWMRWQSISSLVISVKGKNHTLAYAVAPNVCIPPANIPISPSATLQLAIGISILNIDPKPLKVISLKLEKSKRVVLNKVIARAKKVMNAHMKICDFWFNQRLFYEFYIFFNTLTIEETRMINHIGYTLMSLKHKTAQNIVFNLDEWNLVGKGYDKPLTLLTNE